MIELTPAQLQKAEIAADLLREIASALSTDKTRVEVRVEAKHRPDYSKPSSEWYSVVAVWRVSKEFDSLYAQEADDLQAAINKLSLLSELDRAHIRLTASRAETRRAAEEVRRLRTR